MNRTGLVGGPIQRERRLPEAWKQLSTEDVTLAVWPTMQAIEAGILGGNDWFEVLPSALDESAFTRLEAHAK